MDDSTKQALLERFRAYLDSAGSARPELPEIAEETADLYAIFVELAGLRTEVRTESRLVKDALDQFRGVFDMLRDAQATLQRELDRTQAEAREQGRTRLRPLLLDVIDVRDRLKAALVLPAAERRPWFARWRQRPPAAGGEAWQEGLRMTLRRLDQVLQDRNVVALPLVGQPFDPATARAVGTVPVGAGREGIVVEEVRSGFLWNGQVLRTAEVIVSKRGAAGGEKS
jgi:molecular chaperone GrpE